MSDLINIEGGVTLSKRDAWAWFVLPVQSLEGKTLRQIIEIADAETRRIVSLDGHHGHLIGSNHRWSVAEWDAQRRAAVVRPEEGWEVEQQRQVKYLSALNLREWKVFIGVKLPMPLTTGWPSKKNLRLHFQRLRHLGDPRTPEERSKEAHKQAQEIWRKVNTGANDARFATDRECRWLWRHTGWRGFDEVPIEAARPARGGGELLSLVDAIVDDELKYVTVSPSETLESRYVASMVHTHLPKMALPGGDWINLLSKFNLPHSEVNIRFEVRPAHKVLKDLKPYLSRAIDQMKQYNKARQPISPHLQARFNEAQEVQLQTQEGGRPQVYMVSQLMIADKTPEAVYETTAKVQKAYRDRLMDIHVPTTCQGDLHRQADPGDRIRTPRYLQRVAPEMLGGSLYVSGSQLGDGGPYMGLGANGWPVGFDVTYPARHDLATFFALFGTMGGGKTSTLKLIAEQARLMGVSTCILAPPNGEFKGLIERPGIGRYQNITIDESSAGLLDAFRVYRDDRGRAVLLAVDMLRYLLPTELIRLMGDLLPQAAEWVAVNREFPVMGDVVERLHAHGSENAVRAAGLLRTTSRLPMARVCFASQGSREKLDLLHKLTILQLALDLPRVEDRADWSLTDQLSVAMVHAMTALAGSLARAGSITDPKLLLAVEPRVLLQFNAGRSLFERTVLDFRKWNGAIGIDTQNPSHLDTQTLAENLGSVFIFPLGGPREVEMATKFLHLDDAPETRRWVDNVGRQRSPLYRQCLHQDWLKRVGVLHVDLMTPERRQAFSTTPGAQLAAEPVSA